MCSIKFWDDKSLQTKNDFERRKSVNILLSIFNNIY